MQKCGTNDILLLITCHSFVCVCVFTNVSLKMAHLCMLACFSFPQSAFEIDLAQCHCRGLVFFVVVQEADSTLLVGD